MANIPIIKYTFVQTTVNITQYRKPKTKHPETQQKPGEISGFMCIGREILPYM